MNPSRSIVTTKEIPLAEGFKVLANELAWVAGLVEGVAGRVKLDSTKPRPVRPTCPRVANAPVLVEERVQEIFTARYRRQLP
ncbi:hypothetical protein IG631_16048 [Alternaria alternata]|nr:hypothetical protein IG631_16048 [Alternaria alternata]